MAIQSWNGVLLVQLLIILSSAYFQQAQRDNYPPATAKVPTSWVNNSSIPTPFRSYQMILRAESEFNYISCGFYSQYNDSNSFYFAVGLEISTSAEHVLFDVQWLANGNKPVGQNATLELLPDGNLVLRDADGGSVWSTETTNMSVVGMKMMDTGNLVLYDHNNKTVWQSFGYPTAQVPASWTNDNLSISSFSNEGRNRIIMRSEDGHFACGFYSNYEKSGPYYFAIWIEKSSPVVVWIANRNTEFGENATLQLLPGGDLELKDADGTLIWSSNTSDMSVAGIKMMETGNLVLYDVNNKIVWQSFDHPVDVMLLGQKLLAGQRLVSSVSQTNRSEGNFTLSVIPQGVFAYYRANIVVQMYFKYSVLGTVESFKLIKDNRSAVGSLALYVMSAASPNEPDAMLSSSIEYSGIPYMKFNPDGHLRLHDYNEQEGVDLLEGVMSKCDYPTTCGNYGLCSDGRCSCPAGFARDNIPDDQGKYSCSQVRPTTCENNKSRSLLPLEDVYYFNYVDPDAAVLKGTNMESCKYICLNNCSCVAALFQYYNNVSNGNCFLPSPVLSLTADGKNRSNYQSCAFIKISNDAEDNRTTSPFRQRARVSTKIIAGSSVAAFLLVAVIVGLWIVLLRRKRGVEETEEYLDQLPGMPMRFTYKKLRVATGDFEKKLGEGGFGSVFEGNLENGEKIAVKRLEALGQGKKEFLAEVKTIGSIHHVNLVKLIGFCADKLHRVLVYEFMCNGSLDRWIFCRETLQNPLDYQTRRNIIMDIAKGLAYLHEDCRQRIVHLDIKPQNILLDANLHAKVSDFGLSKLIDRDQSQVVTTMRGTPGYLAPELFSSIITEKADVYSFGIVVMEVVCGRKNLDRSHPECMHLLHIFMQKAQEDQLIDMVDKCSEDMQLHRLEAVEILRVAIWCLQSDYTRRPSMSTVVKVLEGTLGVEAELNYSFQNPITFTGIRREAELGTTVTLLPSILSGPR